MVRALATWTEVAVGVSLIAIGALGIKEAKAWESTPGALSSAANTQQQTSGNNKAIMLNGVLHGFSWDGTPSLAPALALPSSAAVAAFLAAYCIGTMMAMSVVTTIIGEGSLRVGERLHEVRPRGRALVWLCVNACMSACLRACV